MLLWNGARPSRRGWQIHPLCAMSAATIPPTMSVASSLLFSAFPLRPKGWRRRMPRALSPSGSTKTKTRTATLATDKVYGVSNCHVLRKDTTVEYEQRGGAPKEHVRVCGMRRFQRGLDEIKKVIGGHGILADLWAREIIKLEEKERQDAENKRSARNDEILVRH